MNVTPDKVSAFERALLALDRISARRILFESASAMSPLQMAEQVVTPALEHIGSAWELGQIALSQVYMSGRICEELVNQLHVEGAAVHPNQLRIAIATLQDHHALGKRLVYSVMRSSGYDLQDFGQGLSVDDLVQRTLEAQTQVLLISVLMLPSALKVMEVRSRLMAEGAPTKIVVGGAPFSLDEALWREVGATACGRYASQAPALVRAVMGGEQP